MRNAQKPNNAILNTIITWLKEGNFVIPDFQRDFEWRPWDISALMRSIFLDYYIGSLLLWKGKKETFNTFSCEPVYGYKNDKDNRQYIVLDGQQRLTALYYVFMSPDERLPNRASRFFYFIRVDKFMADEHDDAFSYEWSFGWVKKYMKNQEAQYDAHVFPFSVLGRGGFELANWAQNYEKHWHKKASELKKNGDSETAGIARQHAENAKKFGERMNDIVQQYQISYIELDEDLSIEKVCDIFTQVNSRGIQLDVFDLINAMLKPKDLQLKHMWREAAPRLEFVDTQKMNVYVLQVISILKQFYCSPKYLYYLLPGKKKKIREPDGKSRDEILVKNTKEFKQHWEVAVCALEGAIKRLRNPQEFGAISSAYLPYASILPVFSSLQSYAQSLPAKQQLNAEQKIRHWYWASVFTSRYSGSVESTSARDFLDVKKWIEDSSDEPGVIAEFKNNTKSLDLRKEVRKNTSVYNGIFNLLVREGARDFSNGKPPQYDDLEDHHIVPVSKEEKLKGLKAKEIHTILNRTPLTAHTNRHVIRDRWPNQYLSELIKENGKSKVQEIMKEHFVSPKALDILLRNPFKKEDFEEFIKERERVIRKAIKALLNE